MSYRVVAVSEELSEKVRTTLKSPQYGHPASVEVAKGYGPCRTCLRKFDEGKEERVLFTYNPFEGVSKLPAPGPVFVHRETCQRYEGDTLPDDIRDLPLLLDGHSADGMVNIRERISDGDADAQIERIMNNPAIQYIQVRNAEAGCFIARIERAV